MNPNTPISRIRHLAIAIGLTFIAALIRFYHLDGQSIWNDEMFSIEVARQSFRDIQPLLVSRFHHPPLFFYLLHAVMVTMGESIWALRLLPAIFGTLTIGTLYFVAAPRWGWKAGIVSSLLCCFSPFHVAYSQEGRPYALAAFLALLSFHFFVKIMEERKTGAYAGYLASTIALLYTHHWGLFLLAAEGGILLFDYFISRRMGAFPLAAAGFAAVCYIPWIPSLLHQATPSGPGEWWWAESPSFNEMAGLSGAFSGTYFQIGSSLFTSPSVMQIAGGACLLVIVVLAVERALVVRDDAAFRYAALLTAGTLFIPFLLSFFRPEIFLWYRYTVIVYPLACLIGGAIAFAGREGYLGRACAAMLILLGLAGIFRYSSWEKSNVKAVAAYLSELTKTNRMLLIRPPYMARMLDYYYSGNAVEVDEAYLDTRLGEIVDTTDAFIYVSLDVTNPIRDYMDGHFDKTSEKVFEGRAHMGIVVDVYRQKPDPEEPR